MTSLPPRPRPFTDPPKPGGARGALKDYLKNQKQGSYTDRGVAFDYDRKTKTYTGGSMGGSYSVPRDVMKQIARGTQGVELRDYYTPKYQTVKETPMKIANPNMPRQPMQPTPTKPRPGMSDPRVTPPRPGMSDPRVTPPRPPVAPGKLPASSMPNGSSPTGRYPGGIGFVNDSGMGPRPRPIAAMVGKGLSQQSATQEGAMKAARAASLAAKKESGSMGGPFGSRNPNGPRKPMGSPSPMSGVAGSALSAMSKGLTGMKKGGMATKKKAGKISEYGGKEMYSSKKGMMKHEGMESMKMEKSEGMKMRGGGMAMRKGYADGGMPMVMKDGKKVPSFAADGRGKMAMGGMATKNKGAAMKHGGMAPKGRGMAIMIAIGKPKGRGKS